MSPTPAVDQLASMITEARHLLDELEGGVSIPVYDEGGRQVSRKRTGSVVDLIRLLELAKGDGYRARSPSGRDGGSRSATDRDGEPMPAYSDPVGELVASAAVVDPVRYNAQSVFRGLSGGIGDLRLAVGSLAKAFKESDLKPRDPGCRSCLRGGIYEARLYRGNRCRWCYDYWLVREKDPPLELVEAHHAGRLITPAMVTAAESKPGRPKRRRARAARR